MERRPCALGDVSQLVLQRNEANRTTAWKKTFLAGDRNENQQWTWSSSGEIGSFALTTSTV